MKLNSCICPEHTHFTYLLAIKKSNEFSVSFPQLLSKLEFFRVWILHGSVINTLVFTWYTWPIKNQQPCSTYWLIQSSCSTCCQCITFIIQSTYVYIASRHYLVEHIITYRIQSKISQPANSKTTAQVKIDFLSRYRSVDLGFVLPSQWCRSYQRETYYNNNKHTSKTAAERGAIREHR